MDGNKKVSIVTHSSGFHTDDIFAVATLSLLLEKDGKEFTITRSRDMSIAEKADYLVDFGSIYDPKIRRFDHHQGGGAGKRENGIPYASFGLVWKEYGDELTGNKKVTDIIDQRLVQTIDAVDNGISYVDIKVPGLRPFDISSIASVFYPTWKEDPSIVDDNFMNLVVYAKFLLKRYIVVIKDKVDAEELVLKNYNESADKRLIILDSSRYPWEEVFSKMPEVLYVIYQNMTDNTWSVKGTRDDLYKFDTRKKLPESWAGKRDGELESITGVPGSVFCHNARFMAVNKTKEGILKMAEIALNS